MECRSKEISNEKRMEDASIGDRGTRKRSDQPNHFGLFKSVIRSEPQVFWCEGDCATAMGWEFSAAKFRVGRDPGAIRQSTCTTWRQSVKVDCELEYRTLSAAGCSPMKAARWVGCIRHEHAAADLYSSSNAINFATERSKIVAQYRWKDSYRNRHERRRFFNAWLDSSLEAFPSSPWQ
jgi:hypothetical protein